MVVPLVSSALTKKSEVGGGMRPDERCKNPAAFPVLSEVLAREIGEPRSTIGCDFWREATDWVIRSTTSVFESAMPDFDEFCITGLDPNCLWTVANCYAIISRTSALIHASSSGEIMLLSSLIISFNSACRF